MQPPRSARPAKKDLWFNAGRYFLRTINREDASDRWAGWLSDPWTTHALNSAPRKMTKSDISPSTSKNSIRGRICCWGFSSGAPACMSGSSGWTSTKANAKLLSAQ